MGRTRKHQPVMRILVAFSRHRSALRWAREAAENAWGPVALASEEFSFHETDYYTPTMGPDLRKRFLAFQRLMDPADLPPTKHQTNQWEEAYRRQSDAVETRPLNLDPGYLSEAKLVLASTKDHAHRLYLCDGIYGEVTLHFQDRQWQAREWTFPDFRRQDYHQFFMACRRYLRSLLKTDSS